MTQNLNDYCYTSHGHHNWFYDKYYFSGANCRYPTFQLAINLLMSLDRPFTIVETGCQRMENDLGAGMSTSIWGELCHRADGHVYTVELSEKNLEVCRDCTNQWEAYITYICSDSLQWLAKGEVKADLLYLDSMDYDYGGLLNLYGGQQDLQAAIKTVDQMPLDEILLKHSNVILPAQEHCLKELRIAQASHLLHNNTILMIDDNQLPGGGKSRLTKEYLIKHQWICLYDYQQSLWVRSI